MDQPHLCHRQTLMLGLGEIELLIILGAFLAAFIVGASGFGDALAAAAVWLHVFPPAEAAPLIVLTGLAVHLFAYGRLRRELDMVHLPPFLLLGAVGVPLGTYLLAQVEADTLKRAVGVFLLMYGTFLLFWRNPPVIRFGGKPLDAAAGGIGGILGGLVGMSGAVPAVWCGLRGWPKAQMRGVGQPYILVMHALSLATMGYAGLVTVDTFARFAWGLPAIVLGTLLGVALYRRLNEELFRKLILLILAGASVTLLL